MSVANAGAALAAPTSAVTSDSAVWFVAEWTVSV